MLSPLTGIARRIAPRLKFHPSLARPAPGYRPRRNQTAWYDCGNRLFSSRTTLHHDVGTEPVAHQNPHLPIVPSREPSLPTVRELPRTCSGCGALSQTIDPGAAGFFNLDRSSIAKYSRSNRDIEDSIFNEALARHHGQEKEHDDKTVETSAETPICDRCHQLLHHSTGTPVIHPGMESIRAIIEESPYKQNHIYHVVDAADFPMSLIPNLQQALRLPRLRTQNRRSKSMRYIRGRVAEVSFIISRSDLLAPKKEQVDSLMPYLQQVLRDALGRRHKKIRLGNVRCVSAKRGWWTPIVKEDIWRRGGAGWMVGKVNVGKSALFEVVFPKGREKERKNPRDRTSLFGPARDSALHPETLLPPPSNVEISSLGPSSETAQNGGSKDAGLSESREIPDGLDDYQESELMLDSDRALDEDDDYFVDEDDLSLLPPAQSEVAYPNMPLVSALPGTTASPIRIPFGRGKGELIDLPGIHRSSLDQHVRIENKADLVMKTRVTPEQYSIKPGQSLLLGGLIRITPRTSEMVFLANPFVPLKPHVTSTDKAVGVQTGFLPDGSSYEGQVTSIAIDDDTKNGTKSAGVFRLEWDVTKKRAGPLTHTAAGKRKVESLPFIVWGADILIEGVGWVELTCQMRSRTKDLYSKSMTDAFGEHDDLKSKMPEVPEVEVFSPEGRFVDVRRPMNAWLLGGPKHKGKGRHGAKGRPRMTIGFKRRTEHGRD